MAPMLAQAALTDSLVGRVLTISSDADDAIALSLSEDGQIKINLADPHSGAVAKSAIDSIVISGGPLSNIISIGKGLSGLSIEVDGGDGDDTITGGNGGETLRGGAGNDTINGKNGKDNIFGDDGNDTLNGGNGKDTIEGGAGDDVISGGNGNDKLTGGDGVDQMRGNNGKDVLVIDSSDSVFSGGKQHDKCLLDGSKVACSDQQAKQGKAKKSKASEHGKSKH